MNIVQNLKQYIMKHKQLTWTLEISYVQKFVVSFQLSLNHWNRVNTCFSKYLLTAISNRKKKTGKIFEYKHFLDFFL